MTGVTGLRLFVHVEEPSMKAAMEALLPNLLPVPQAHWKIIDHGSKQALLRAIPDRLRGYANWSEAGLRILVLVDRDRDDCIVLKRRLEQAAAAAGLATKSAPNRNGRFKVVNRIVVEELEAWFFGDVTALASAFPGVPPTLGRRARYGNPDAISGGTWEALYRILQAAGHYVGTTNLPKVELARRVAPLMVPDRNTSASFATFVTGLRALVASP